MKLLVACPRKLLLVDSTNGDVQVVETHRPEYYGITWPEHGQSMCLGHSGVENASLGTLQSYMDSELGWISCGASQGPPSLSAAHQILWVGDRVITTNTGRNCLTVFRTDDWFYRHYWMDDIRWDRKGRDDLCGSHLNSVFLRDQVLYVVAQDHNRGSNLIRVAWPEMQILGVDRTTTLMAHNVWVTEDGQVIVCDSMRGTLVDVATHRVVWQCEVPNVVTRGLASNGEYVFVGHSAIGTRENRVNRDGRVWVIERATWKTVDSVLLAGSGNVHEVRILDEPDLCHHGHVFCGQLGTIGSLDELNSVPLAIPAPSPVALHDALLSDTMSDRWEQQVGFARLDGDQGTAADFSLAITGQPACDVVVRAQIDIRDRPARHMGLVARYQGPADSNMIVALIAKADSGYRAQLWQQHDGQWSCLKTAKLRRGHGTLELKTLGPTASVLFDRVKVLDAAITGPVQAGRVGVRSARGSFAAFQSETLPATQHPAGRGAAA